MANLTTHYLGLQLRNPVIAGSSGLMNSIKNLESAEEAGAGAVVLKSIFEEQILMEIRQGLDQSDLHVHPEALDYMSRMTREHSIDAHLKLIRTAKASLHIPVIASVNCIHSGEWMEYSRRIEDAGADALELNVFITDVSAAGSAEIESRYLRILSDIQDQISIPVVMKIGSQFSNPAKMIRDLSRQGADGLVLFNRFWSPDIDVDKSTIVPASPFSAPAELSLPLRWIALLSDQVDCDLCGSTGVHDHEAVIKLIMAGAQTVQVSSILYKNGIAHLKTILQGMHDWLDGHQHAHIDEIRGMMSSKSDQETKIWGRAQFIQYYSELE